jgi:DNA-binding response OmpR family regulator
MSAILIVDDDPHIRELAKVFLQHEGFDIYEACDGVEALSTLERLKGERGNEDVMS